MSMGSRNSLLLRVAIVVLPLFVFSLLCAGNIIAWRNTELVNRQLTKSQSEIIAEQVALRIETYLQEKITDLTLLAALLRNNAPGHRQEYFQRIATEIIDQNPQYFCIYYFDQQGEIKARTARGRDEIDHDPAVVLTAAERGKGYEQVRATGKPFICRYEAGQSAGPGILIWYPLFINIEQPRQFSGAVLAAFKGSEMISFCTAGTNPDNFCMQVGLDGRQVFDCSLRMTAPSRLADHQVVRKDFNYLAGAWSVAIGPHQGSSLSRLDADNLRQLVVNVSLAVLLSFLLGMGLLSLDRLQRSRRELLSSEERYRRLTENARDMIYRMTLADGVYEYVSPASSEITGYSSQDFYDTPCRLENIVAPGFRERYAEYWLGLLTGESLPYQELQIIHKDGSTRWILQREVIVRDEQGRPFAVEGIISDITERKQAEEELQISNRKYKDLFENANDAIFLVNTEKRYVAVNKKAVELFGYSRDEFLTMSVYDAIPAEQVPRSKAEFHKLAAQGGYDKFEGRFRSKDGRLLDIEVSSSAIVENGVIVGSRDIVRDISERKQAERELRKYREHLEDLVEERTAALVKVNKQLKWEVVERQRAERRLTRQKNLFQAAFNSVPDGMVLSNVNHEIVTCNPGLQRIFGYGGEEVVGRRAVFLYENEKDFTDLDRDGFQAGSGGQLLPAIVNFRRKSGETFAGETFGACIRDESGSVIGYLDLIRDISDRIALEEERQRSQKLQSIGILAGGIAHDFNNILTAILGNISLAKVYAGSREKVLEKLVATEKASLRAKNLTHQLLTFSKGGAPVKKTASIAELIMEPARFILSGSNVKCQFSIPEDLWCVEADAGQICQVIENLVKNADQAMPDGGVLTIAAEHVLVDRGSRLDLKQGRYVKISFHDEGSGIVKEHLPNIFDPYFTTKRTGNGLGLSVSYSIIKKHNGTITVDSQPGAGTTIAVYLPSAGQCIFAAGESDREAAGGSGKVLVMDDEEGIKEIAGEMLKSLGYEVSFASDGAETITLYQTAMQAGSPIDAIVMDLTIPGGMGGKETVAALLEIDPAVRALASSGYANNPVMADFRKFGFKGILPKPYRIEDLAKALTDMFEVG